MKTEILLLVALALPACTARQAADTSRVGEAGAMALPPGFAQLAQLQADAMSKRFEAIDAQQKADRLLAIEARDAAIAAGKAGAEVPVVRAENPKMTLPEWLGGIAGLLGIGLAAYAHRRANDAKATAVEAKEAGVATANAIVPALASVRAGVPLADVAYVLEDKGVPIDMGNPQVVAATATVTPAPPRPQVPLQGAVG